MKQLISISIGCCLAFCLADCSQKQPETTEPTINKSNASPLEGAWELVWEDHISSCTFLSTATKVI